MQENIEKIISWDADDFMGLIEFLKSIWTKPNDVIVEWKLLGGQQYCEFSVHNTDNLPEQTQYTNALLNNKRVKSQYHYKWIRGGNNYFLINVTSLGWIPVKDFIRQKKVTRQAIYNQKGKYKLLYVTPKKVLVNIKTV